MMTFITAHKKLSRFLGGAAAAIFWVGVWQLISMLADSPVLLPAPFEVLVCLSGLVKTSDFWLSAANSLGGIAAGCLLGTAAGVLLAVAACAFRPLYSLLSPLISVIVPSPMPTITSRGRTNGPAGIQSRWSSSLAAGADEASAWGFAAAVFSACRSSADGWAPAARTSGSIREACGLHRSAALGTLKTPSRRSTSNRTLVVR